jgi:glycosyltransferase involved in cell wall biosynthesis
LKPERAALVVTGGQEYWAPGSSQGLRMAEAFRALGCAVLYVECGGAGRLFRDRTAGRPAAAPGVWPAPGREGLFLARARTLPGMRLSWPDPVRRLHCRAVSRLAAAWLGRCAGPREPAAVHYGWFFPELLAGRGDVRHVYECLDDHTGALNIRPSGWRRRYVRRVEDDLLRRAELAVFSSRQLALARAGRCPRAEVLPLGVDHEHFARRPGGDPDPGARPGRPRVGFLGRVTAREDWRLAAAAAALAPDLDWVVLGPAEGLAPPAGPDNLRFAGAAPYEDLPDWLGPWDAAFVPLADSEFNRAAWPLKFFELLAAGLAVAATPLPAALELSRQTNGLVVPAEGWSAEQFAAAVRRALELRPRARAEGPAFAARHSWRERAGRVLGLLE